jgi:hypothetical protein|nr:MAG TPA: hypothetical protein [Caudoviricetes sp.]
MDYKLSKTELFLQIALVLIVISGVVLLFLITVDDIAQDRQIREAKARCESAGGKLGHLKCYKDGKEI